MSDLIDRQAVMDLWEKYHHTIAVNAIQYDAELRQLPSAQPEIIRCKDCRYYKTYQYVNGIRKFLPKCSFNDIYVAEEDFCSQAERKNG